MTEILKKVVTCCCGNCEIEGHEKEQVIPLTAEEIAQLEEITAEFAEYQANLEAKLEAKASAQAKLTALGLTAEEIAALSN